MRKQTTQLKIDLNRYFNKRYIWVANKYMKRFSTSLGIREIKLKITMKYHYRPIRMTTIKKRNEL